MVAGAGARVGFCVAGYVTRCSCGIDDDDGDDGRSGVMDGVILYLPDGEEGRGVYSDTSTA